MDSGVFWSAISALGTCLAAFVGWLAYRASLQKKQQRPVQTAKQPPSNLAAANNVWPTARTLKALSDKIARTSKKNKQILLCVAQVDYIYVMHLVQEVQIPRSELVYRGKDLEAQQLIESIPMTDTAYRLHSSIDAVLGEKHNKKFVKLLKATASLSDAAEEGNLICKWFVSRDGKSKQGPFSLGQLKELVKSGDLEAQDMALAEGDARWVSATSIPGLFNMAQH